MEIDDQQSYEPQKITLPKVPIIFANARQTVMLNSDGEIRILDHMTAAQLINDKPVITCHAPYMRNIMNFDSLNAYDVLELFAFVHPAQFCVPTPKGIANTLDLDHDLGFDDIPTLLLDITYSLLAHLKRDPWKAKADPIKIAGVMGQQGKGWNWTPYIFEALGQKYDPDIPPISKADLNIWKNLPNWSEEAPKPPPSHHPVTGDESRNRLKEILGDGSEERLQQVHYATSMTAAFAPKDEEHNPLVVLAEAGTGVGKTLGYLAPASVWSEKNQGAVWVSTYTKNLQRQVNDELSRVYPNKELKESKVAIRKGRENYLCLLNYEDVATGASLSTNPRHAIGAGLMARWIAATNDGDVSSGVDFPGWLSSLLGYQFSSGLADRRGECIYSACDHYHRCFVERSVRKAKHASVVVANHALVMIQTAMAAGNEELPQRYVFDEAHHLFDAADSAFVGHLTARETFDLRRWLRGAETSRKTRVRGLKTRIEDLISGDEKLNDALQDILERSRILTANGWQKRLRDKQPKGACEEFILQLYEQIIARAANDYGSYSIETETFPLHENMPPKIQALKQALKALQKPMLTLADGIREKINNETDQLETDTRKRLDAVQSGLERRAHMSIGAWINMLETLMEGKPKEEFVDWMEIERVDGRTIDIGLYRHWVDPMVPFANTIKPHAHGIAFTSATLTDSKKDNWEMPEKRTGAAYISENIVKEQYSSPFRYNEQSKIIVVQDVAKNDPKQVAAAYLSLFKASGGSAIGLFTAISRLKAVYDEIRIPLSDQNIPLYGQHIEGMDVGTLIDIFRSEEKSCLLGTDAIRDGVDVPGDSLKLMVFDRIPWPRPTILHKARRNQFGNKAYDDMITRLKLKQAYGRLIRRKDDKGVFVMLDSMMPSRLYDAFPENCEILKLGIKDSTYAIEEFLK
ncbi:MAG: ATP-dependent DNA helicase [Pseudomonadota bacterium]